MLVTCNCPVPVLLIVTVFGVAWPIGWLPKSTGEGETPMPGVACSPVPLNVSWCGPPALSAMLRIALRAAANAGVNVRLMFALAPAAILIGAGVLVAKSFGLLPEKVSELIVIWELPVLLTVITCGT